ncbi:multidrug effflux MFS transporter [Rhodophyticola sp. CCM32]|uniref:multidrug effflux MFS transporter n=1 Tax=Rhodophyticola sp. CCM32 TaxID=2916397 RepID=UPI001EE5BB91|nr:multidrug effflux MFS transporter [Rhodophyticola sp. CCM32]
MVRFLDRTTPPHIFTLIMLTGIGALSMNLFLPSLPNMSLYFGTDYQVMQLSVAGYLGVNAILQLFVGPLSDQYGRRPVLLWGLGIFILASLGCIFSTSIEVFLLFRMIQGAVVVGMVLGRAVVRDMVPQEEAASMIGYITMGMAVAPMIGPVFGGILDQTFGWKSNFLVLAGLGMLVWLLIWRDLGETAPRNAVSFRAQFAEYPELLTSRRFWGYCAAAGFAAGAFFAYLGGAPYVGSVVFGLSPAKVGFFFGAPALGYFFGNFISGRFSVRMGINTMILWGCIITTVGVLASLLLFLAGLKTAVVFFGFMTFVGLGNGLVMPNATSGMLSVRPHLAGTASGIGGSIMIGGGAALSALAGTLLTVGEGAFPLIWIMLITSVLALFSILYTIRRERQISGL